MRHLTLISLTAMSLALAACGGSSSNGGGGTTTPTPTNVAPVADAGAAILLQNADSAEITLVATDADGDSLTYAISTQPASGTATISGNVVSYTPNTDFSGTDSFAFTANDGTVNSAPAIIDLTVQPTSSFSGKVSEADGAPVADITVEALDGSGNVVTSAMSDTDGEFTLTAVTAQNLVLNFSSPNYADQVLPVTMPDLKSIAIPLDVTVIARGAVQTIDIDAGGTLAGDSGASVTLTAGSFVDANGAPLQLSNGATAEIEIPIYTAIDPATGDPIEMGDEIALWSLSEDTGIWEQEGTGIVVANTDSPTGLALKATVNHFTWWNCDIAISTATVDVTIVGTADSGVADIKGRAENGFGGFRTGNRSVSVGSTTTGMIIPANRETCFWITYIDASGASAQSDEQCIDDAIANSTYNLSFSAQQEGPLVVGQPRLEAEYFVLSPLSVPVGPRTLETDVTYSVTSGTLPAGLALSPTSATTTQIIGTPTTIESQTVTIEGVDSDGNTDSKIVTFEIIDTVVPSLQDVATSYAAVGDSVTQTIIAEASGGAPTSWIVTLANGSPAPTGVSISSDGVFTIDSFDATATSFTVTAFNIKGASNSVTFDILDLATAPPILSGFVEFYLFEGSGGETRDLSSLNSGAPATSWTVTPTNGTPSGGATITNAGVLTVVGGGFFPDMEFYEVTAFNGTVASNTINVQVTYEDPFINDPCMMDPDMCI